MAKVKSNKKRNKIKSPAYSEGSSVSVSKSASVVTIDYPVFCFKHIVKGYELDKCDKQQKANFASKLMTMTQKSWRQLLLDAYETGAGFERINKAQIKGSLPLIITEDVDCLYCIKFNSKKSRILGHKSNHIFHVTHIDINLKSYKH